ncbi:MAG TPA: hypothetical protein VF033_02580 [Steroidobacteraceae bacterium]
MLNHPFPRTFDNNLRGRKAALWLLGAMVLLKGLMGINCVFNGYEVAVSVDAIPLHEFPPAAAATVVGFFAIWAWGLLLMSLLGALALIRYRAMVPLVYLLLLAEQLGRKWILTAMTIAHSGGSSSAGSINNAIVAILLIGLALSLWSPSNNPQTTRVRT